MKSNKYVVVESNVFFPVGTIVEVKPDHVQNMEIWSVKHQKYQVVYLIKSRLKPATMENIARYCL